MEKNIRNLIDFKKIDTLLEGFNKSTGFATAILDLEGNVLSKSEWRNICTEFHRMNPETSQRCIISDTVLSNKMEEGEKYHAYECLNRLVDVAVPLKINGEHVANLFAGQFFFEKPDVAFFKGQAKEFGFDERKYLDALSKVPVVSEEKVKTAMDFLLNMTEFISDQAIQKLEQAELNQDLRDSEARYKAIFESTGTATLIVDEDTTILLANKECFEMFGYDPAQLNGQKWTQVVATESVQEMLRNHQLRRKNPKLAPQKYEVKVLNSKGEKRDAVLNVNMIPGTKQSVVSMLDITEHKQAEEELQKSKSSLEEYFENDISANYVVSVFSGEIFSCNKTFLNLFGFEKKSETEKFDITELYKNPEDRKHMIRLVQKHRKVENHEVDFISKEGTTIYALKNAIGIFDKYDKLEKIRGYVVDITERKDIEKELQKSEEKYRRFFENDITGNYHTTLDGKILTCNNAFVEMLKYKSKEDIHAINISEIYFENSDRDKFINKLRAEKKLQNHECTLKARDGSEVEIIENVIGIFDESGELKEIVGYMSDITEQKKAQMLLYESEKKFRNLFENHAAIKLLIDPENGNIVEANKSAADFYGWTVETLEKMNIGQLNTLPAEALKKEMEKVVALKKTNFEFKHRRADGSQVDVEVFSSSVDIEGKQFLHSIIQDISEKKKAQEELIINEQLLSSVMDTQHELICRYLPDTTIVFVNKAYCKLFGQSERDLIGKKFLQFVPKTEWATELSRIEQLNVKNPSITSVSQAITPGSSIISIEWTDVAIFDGSGKVVAIQSVGRDITEKLKAEHEIIHNSQMQTILRTIASTFINIPVELIDREIQSALEQIGNFVKGDRVYIFDYDWVNYTCSNTFEWCKEGIEPQIDYLQNVPLDEIPQWVNPHRLGKTLNIPDVLKLPANDGVRKILEPQGIKSLLTIPIMHNDLCVGFIGFDSVRKQYTFSESEEKFLFLFSQQFVSVKNRQILENSLVKAKEKAEASDKLKTAFINNISHEIRTPLNGILGFGEILADPEELPAEERKQLLKSLHESSDRLMNTVSDYMDMAMVVSGTMKVHKTEFTLESLFEEITRKAERECTEKSIEFNFETTSESNNLSVNSDPELIQKILGKLLDNAIKFTKEGSITFGYGIKAEYIEFFVRDAGIGINSDKLDTIFELFGKEDTTLTSGYEGSGLGLTIAKGLVTLLGGQIYATSEKEKGSIFTFTIPLNNSKNSVSRDEI